MILLSQILTFVFVGGDHANLASAISDAFDKPVVIFSDIVEQIPKSTLKDRTQNNPEQRIPSIFRLDRPSLDTWGLGPRGWSFYFVNKNSRFEDTTAWKPFVVDSASKDKTTNSVTTKGLERMRLGDINRLWTEREIKWHWFFDEAKFVVHAKNVDRKEFTSLVADAAGATYVEKDNFLDINYDVFRSRWKNISVKKLNGYPIDRREYAKYLGAALVGSATNAELRKMMESTSGLLAKPVKWNSELGFVASKYIEFLKK